VNKINLNALGLLNATSSISFQDKVNLGHGATSEGKNAGLSHDINAPENPRDFKKYFDRILKLECDRMDRVNIALK